MHIKHEFQKGAADAGEGKPLVCGDYVSCTIEITGTATSFSVSFYAKYASGVKRPLVGMKEGDTNFTMAISTTSATGADEVWSFDFGDADTVIMEVTAVAGGYVDIDAEVST